MPILSSIGSGSARSLGRGFIGGMKEVFLSTATFNNGGTAVIGNLINGPDINESLSGLSNAARTVIEPNFTMPVNGVQSWRVSYSGLYRVIVAGARGGSSGANNNYFGSPIAGGRGAIVLANVYLSFKDTLYIIAGHRGGYYNGSQDGGGGGGSFVSVSRYANGGSPNFLSSTLLVAAGGGGGGASNTNGGIASMDGASGQSGGGLTPGTGGYGGQNGSGSEHGAGGGGWFGPGTGASQTRGKAVRSNDLAGATGVYGLSQNVGGFGGGAAGWGAGGGGGGYSGGGPKTHASTRSGGGGGGSFVSSGANNISYLTGNNGNWGDLGNGYVTLTAL